MEYRDIDDYINKINSIYEPIKNNERDFYQILARLVESIAKCSQYVNKNNEPEIGRQLPALFAWFSSLVVKAIPNNKNLGEILWSKYPGCCPYCLQSQCNCLSVKRSLEENQTALQKKAEDNNIIRPKNLKEWQEMFAKIYPRNPQGYSQQSNFIHLIEEVGEVAEGYRLRYFHPDNLSNELADVMTWIFGIANLIDARAKDSPSYFGDNKYILEEHIQKKYKDGCPICKKKTCLCINKDVEVKISESNPLYPSDIANQIEGMREELVTASRTAILDDLKAYYDSIDIESENTVEISQKFIEQSKKKKWYQNISASGMTESAIVNSVNTILQALLSGG